MGVEAPEATESGTGRRVRPQPGARVAAECLVTPKAVITGPDDPQAQQVREFCKVNAVESRALRVLDYGGGQGRLLSAMHENSENPEDFAAAVDYRAFEPYPDESGRLENAVAGVYGAGNEHRVYHQRDRLRTIDNGSVDIIVMCNVLHEIPPDEWSHLFGDGGVIAELLSPEGHLLVLEDMEMPHGEKAHRFGFLLLDGPHLHKLMQCTEEEGRRIRSVEARGGRLKAHAIPTGLVGRTDRDAVTNALKLLKETARDEITRIRGQELNSRSGRLHALWTQLLANADLGLLALG